MTFETAAEDENDHRYIYGIDLASKKNYTAVIIHDLSFNQKTIPKLVGIYKLPHRPYYEYMDFLTKNVYSKFPPYYQVLDYTAEKSFTDILVRDFGPEKVEGINFNVATKKMLKDDGLSVLKQGYKFPNLHRLDPLTKKLITEMVGQLQREKMDLSPSGQEIFPKPKGHDNDLAIAWELSIHGCIKFMLGVRSSAVVMSADYAKDENETQEEFDPNDPFPELNSSRYKILSSSDF